MRVSSIPTPHSPTYLTEQRACPHACVLYSHPTQSHVPYRVACMPAWVSPLFPPHRPTYLTEQRACPHACLLYSHLTQPHVPYRAACMPTCVCALFPPHTVPHTLQSSVHARMRVCSIPTPHSPTYLTEQRACPHACVLYSHPTQSHVPYRAACMPACVCALFPPHTVPHTLQSSVHARMRVCSIPTPHSPTYLTE